MIDLLASIASLRPIKAAERDTSLPSVLTIIPTALSDEPMLRQCIASLKHASKGTLQRIIFVLCPSMPEKVQALQKIAQEESAEYIALEAPFSFARSNNAALKLLKDEEYVLFLNDDCFFHHEFDVKRLILSLESRKLTAIGPWFKHRSFERELPNDGRALGMAATRYPILGACMLWSRSWLDRIGHFDESFDGYGMEEADLLYRALEMGGRWMRDDRITVDHIHHATFGGSIKKEEPHLRNLQRWSEKYPGIDSWGKTREWKRNLRAR